MPHLSVVVPTFNEAAHVRELLGEIGRACAPYDYEIVVVDDNSPDGTYPRVVEAQRENPRIVPVLRATERGLATAVIEGLRRAQGELVVVLDSDFQHPPATIPQLVEAAQKNNADLVVASRYAAGGAVTGFPFRRRVVSWGAKTLAVLGLPRVRRFRITDPMSGFFLVRRGAVPPDALRPLGYKILVEILARGRIDRAEEVGYRFESRRGGESKLGIRTQWDYFRHVAALALADPENRRLLLFLAVGLTGIVVNAGAYELLKRLLHATTPTLLLIPATLAREVAILWNFAWNDSITFRDLRAQAQAGFFRRVVRFNLVSAFAWAVYLGLFYLLVVLAVDDLIALLAAIAVTFVINYRGNRQWTYAARADSRGA